MQRLVERQVDTHPWDAYDGSHEVDNGVYFPCKISIICKITDTTHIVQIMTIPSTILFNQVVTHQHKPCDM